MIKRTDSCTGKTGSRECLSHSIALLESAYEETDNMALDRAESSYQASSAKATQLTAQVPGFLLSWLVLTFLAYAQEADISRTEIRDRSPLYRAKYGSLPTQASAVLVAYKGHCGHYAQSQYLAR